MEKCAFCVPAFLGLPTFPDKMANLLQHFHDLSQIVYTVHTVQTFNQSEAKITRKYKKSSTLG